MGSNSQDFFPKLLKNFLTIANSIYTTPLWRLSEINLDPDKLEYEKVLLSIVGNTLNIAKTFFE